MWEQFWQAAVRNVVPVYYGLAIVLVVTTIIRRWLDAHRKLRATYVLFDGGLNSLRVTLEVLSH